MTFLLERAPPLVFVLLAAGPCFSSLYMTEGVINIEKLVWGFLGQFVSKASLKKQLL